MTLDDLVEVLLNKGAVLHLDLIVSVAGIPLIGVSLRAVIAGMETMLEYGMLRQWDEETRAWAERSAFQRALDLRDGEQVVAHMSGGHLLDSGVCATWRPGTVHLTDRRLAVVRREPREVMWQTDLTAVRGVRLERERTVGGEPRTRVRVTLADGDEALLSAAEPENLRDLLVRTCPGPLALDSSSPSAERPGDEALLEGRIWYHEPRRNGPLWRGGHGRITPAGLVWKSPLDARPALVVPAADITAAHIGGERGPAGEGTVLVVETVSQGPVTLAADDPHRWTGALHSSRSGSPSLPTA